TPTPTIEWTATPDKQTQYAQWVAEAKDTFWRGGLAKDHGFIQGIIQPVYTGETRELHPTLNGEEVTILAAVGVMPDANNAIRELFIPLSFTQADGTVLDNPYMFMLRSHTGDVVITLDEFLQTTKPGDQIGINAMRTIPAVPPNYCGHFTFCGWR